MPTDSVMVRNQIGSGPGQVGRGAGARVGDAPPGCRQRQQHLLGLHQWR